MKRIGLIGEDPNDTTSIKTLLLKKHPQGLAFEKLLKNKRGYQLDNARVAASLKIEFEAANPHFIIFIRDVNGLPTEKDKIKKVEDWFNKLNSIVNRKGILLKNIYELEALILADIATFNSLYKTKITFSKSVMHQEKPKEFLMQKTKNTKNQYQESHCPKIFNRLNIDVVLKNCTYFKEFYQVFQEKVGV